MGRRSGKINSNYRKTCILIDGRVLKHKNITGVERYATEIVNRLTIPFDIAIPQFENRWFQHLWEHFALPAKATGYKVLFCPSNMAPLVKPPGVKLVTTIHDVSFLNYPESFSLSYRVYYRMLTPLVIRNSDVIITVSNFEKDELSRKYPSAREKITVIYSGISEEFLNCGVSYKKDDYILYVGNLSYRKNFHGLLKAYSLVWREIDKKLLIVGMKPDIMKIDRKVRKILGEIPKDMVEFLGQINDTFRLVSLYRRASLFIFPSLYESFGFPALEAMACGCPVVVSNTAALPEICGDSAVYVNPLFPEDIANGIFKVANDDKLRRNLIVSGKERAKLFTWDKSVKSHVGIFSALTKEC